MIPLHARVAAFDDNPEHLRNIVNGLGKAGFWAMPFLFDLGHFEPELTAPFPGIRLVFTDIHLGAPLGNSMATFASAIINGLKKVVSDGPYGLIFWSQYPEEAQSVWAEISERAGEAGLKLPVWWDVIDKNKVMSVGTGEGEGDSQFDANELRSEILKKIYSADVLCLAMSWDERVAHAAMHVTNQLYHLAASNGDLSQWTHLLAYLGQEAVGKERAEKFPVAAVDNAMLPLLEDRLSAWADYDRHHDGGHGRSISDLLRQQQSPLSLPAGVSAAVLNTHYLVEDVNPKTSHMWERGMVTRLDGGFRNSAEFITCFGMDVDTLIEQEFLLTEQRNTSSGRDALRKGRLHVVELSAECDQVQGKIGNHRYLLALYLPSSLLKACRVWDKKRNRYRNEYANVSIVNVGEICPKACNEAHVLLVSTRRYMVLPPGEGIDGTCVFRLRRTVIEELAHYYVTHSRRPGVMRFN